MGGSGKAIGGSGSRMARCVVLAMAALLLPLVQGACAMLVTVDLGWGYDAGWGAGNADANLLSDYNLQQGSVVQIIMYNSSSASPPGSSASANFPAPITTYNGEDLSAEPYTTGHVPDTTDAYNPFATPDGHVIAYTTQIGPAISDPGGYWFNITAQFNILGTYDRLYIRVFGQDDIYEQGFWASYWGIGPVQTNTGSIYSWFVDPIDNVEASQANYFCVIPEPGTLAFGLLGGIGLWIGRSKKRAGGRT